MIRLKIKEIAQQKGMSQRRLSLRSGVDINTVRKLIQYPFSNVTTETLDKFAKVLGVDACPHLVWELSDLVHNAAAENPESKDKENHNSNAQSQNYPAQRKCGQCVTVEGGHHSETQSLGGVGQWVEERDDLEPFDRVGRAPGIVGAAGKDQGREDQ